MTLEKHYYYLLIDHIEHEYSFIFSVLELLLWEF